jgi:signal-transduction protein with cAMP-binding, CBS, and nucleotidyltransferase domain
MAKMSEYQAHGLSTTLGFLDLRPLTIVSESDSLDHVAKTMLNRGISCVVLEEPPLRVVTERDLAVAWAQNRSPNDCVALVSSTNPYWASLDTTVAEAAALMMRLGIRHLVVLDIDGRPIGVVSMIELFSILVHSQEPLALYASFSSFMARGARA